MITFLFSGETSFTHKALLDPGTGVPVKLMTYDELFANPALEPSTYVFTDLDVLAPAQIKRAAVTYRRIRGLGLPALNDPARVLSRFGLLRRLFLAGINRFNVYRVEEGIIPQRWPVFLRCEGDHEGPMTSLLNNWQDVERAVAGAFARGLPLATLLMVEYAAEPLPSGAFRKFASFKVGQSTFAHTCVHSDHWVAKTGKIGVATQAMYEEENRIVRENPFGPEVAKAFEIAGIDYGRVDFGVVEGRVQIYEINQNPDLKFGETHPVPTRCESYRIFEQNYLKALRALDAAGQAGSAPATAMATPAYSFGRS